MKKINSVGYGGKVIGAGLLCLLAGAVLRLISFLTGVLWLRAPAGVLFSAGILVLILFAVLLRIEFCQDRKLEREYEKIKNRKLSLGNGRYECQACGSRHVRGKDKSCDACGVSFREESGKPAAVPSRWLPL